MRAPVTLPFYSYEARSNGPNPGRVANDPATIEVTSPFGWRDIGNGPYYHAGLDIANGHFGAELVAVAAGKVVAEGFLGWPWAQPGNFYGGTYGGLQCYVEIAGGLIVQYAHMNDTVVSAGDEVREGQLLGHIGATGNTGGAPHCHHGLIRATVSAIRSKGFIPNDWCVDPAPYYFGGVQLPDTAMPGGDDMEPVLLRSVIEQWWTRQDPNTEFWTGGPGLGEKKAFVGAQKVWSVGETVDGVWRVIEINGELVWTVRKQLFPIAGTRSPKEGYGLVPITSGYTKSDLDSAKAIGRADGIKAAIDAVSALK